MACSDYIRSASVRWPSSACNSRSRPAFGSAAGFWMAATSIILLFLLVVDELYGIDLKEVMYSQPQEKRRRRDRDHR